MLQDAYRQVLDIGEDFIDLSVAPSTAPTPPLPLPSL